MSTYWWQRLSSENALQRPIWRSTETMSPRTTVWRISIGERVQTTMWTLCETGVYRRFAYIELPRKGLYRDSHIGPSIWGLIYKAYIGPIYGLLPGLIHIGAYAHIGIHIHAYIYQIAYAYICICIYTNTHVWVCTYMWYSYTHIHICICTYTITNTMN